MLAALPGNNLWENGQAFFLDSLVEPGWHLMVALLDMTSNRSVPIQSRRLLTKSIREQSRFSNAISAKNKPAKMP